MHNEVAIYRDLCGNLANLPPVQSTFVRETSDRSLSGFPLAGA